MSRARIRYQTLEFEDTDVHLRTLRDRQQFSDDDKLAENCGVPPSLWPLFGVVWASGKRLAQLMMEQDIRDIRILEVGCGIAVPSLVLRYRGADITATDYHPLAGDFLVENTALNELSPIHFVRSGWTEQVPGLDRYDLVIGSDLLYEESSVEALPGFIDRHTMPDGKTIIVDPRRGLQRRFARRMIDLGFTEEVTTEETLTAATEFDGSVMRFSRQ